MALWAAHPASGPGPGPGVLVAGTVTVKSRSQKVSEHYLAHYCTLLLVLWKQCVVVAVCADQTCSILGVQDILYSCGATSAPLLPMLPLNVRARGRHCNMRLPWRVLRTSGDRPDVQPLRS